MLFRSEALAAYHNHTIAELTVDTLMVQLLEDVLKVAREVHFTLRTRTEMVKVVKTLWRDVRT